MVLKGQEIVEILDSYLEALELHDIQQQKSRDDKDEDEDEVEK